MVTTVLVIFLLLLVVVCVFLNLYQIENKNTQICEQRYELKEKENRIRALDFKLKECTAQYADLYEEFERYKQLNPNDKHTSQSTPYDLVRDILDGKGEIDEME